MDFALLPPEVNSGLMYAGPGAGPMLVAAAGWDSVAASLESTASGYSSEIAGLSGKAWSGPSSTMMVAAATPYVAWLQASAAAAGQTAVQAYGAVAAYEAAFAATVPPPVVAANRVQLAVLVATNILGQNTPAIAATEAQYAEMWAQDAAAMYGYASAAQTASTLKPFDPPPRTTNAAGQVTQARAMTQATGHATAARTQSVVQMASSNATHQLNSTVVSQQAGAALETSYTNTTSAPVAYALPDGSTVTVGPGGTVAYYSTSTIDIAGTGTVEQGGTLTVGPAGDLIVDSGGFLTVYDGSFMTIDGSLTIDPGVIGYAAAPGGFVIGPGASVLVSAPDGAFILGSGDIIFDVADGSTYVIVAPVAPAPTSALGGLNGLLASPGLVGTSGIQPQLNAPLLAEWARGVASGLDLAAHPVG